MRLFKGFSAARVAVSGLFFVNGFLVGNWAPMIPEFANRLGLTDSNLGLMILLFGVGSLAMMPMAGALVARYGSRKALIVGSFASAPVLLLITLAPNINAAAIVMVILGGLIGSVDVVMNANAVAVEGKEGRSITSSCHGFWSLGGLIGAPLGGVLIAVIGSVPHAISVSVVAGVLVWLCVGSVFDDRASEQDQASGHKLQFPRSPLPYLIGLVGFFSMVPEGAILDWGAKYLREELATAVAYSGLAYGVCAGTMAVVRFGGDNLRSRMGDQMVFLLSAVIACGGMLMAGLAPNWVVAICGFGVAGVGLANLVPIIFSTAGKLPGLAPGIGISVVTSFAYAGILVAPASIGYLAEYVSFSTIFCGLSLLILIAAGLAVASGGLLVAEKTSRDFETQS